MLPSINSLCLGVCRGMGGSLAFLPPMGLVQAAQPCLQPACPPSAVGLHLLWCLETTSTWCLHNSRERWGLPLALQTCPALCANCCSPSNAGSWTERELERQGWLWGGCTGVPTSPGNLTWGAWGGEGEWVLAAPSLSISTPHHCPRCPCGAPTVSLYMEGHGWAGVSSHTLSPALLPPCLWHHQSLSTHWLCLSFPFQK